MAESTIYTGAWIDHTKSSLWAPTLTVTTAQAFILTSFLAVFITIIGAHLWGLIRYALHQLRFSRNPQDAMYHQKQMILRNSASPSSATWELFKVGFAWRRRPGYGFKRVLPLLCVAALQASFFALAGVFSSEIFWGNAVVLVESSACGYLVAPTAAVESKDPSAYARLNAALVESKIAADASAAYARSCYGNMSTNAECNSFLVQRLPASYELVACPFANETCLEAEMGALRADTGYIYTDSQLGINSAKEDSLAYRRVTTCAPIRTDGYSTWRTNSAGAEQYLDLLYSKSTTLAKRQITTYDYGKYDIVKEEEEEEDEEIAEEEYSVDDDDADVLEEEYAPIGETLKNEELPGDESLSTENLKLEETASDDELTYDDVVAEYQATVDDSQLNKGTVDEVSPLKDTTLDETTADEATAEEVEYDETTTTDDTPVTTRPRPGKPSDEMLEDEIADSTEDDVELDDTLPTENETIANGTSDKATEFQEATTATTKVISSVVAGSKATSTASTTLLDEIAAATAALKNTTTSWMDEALDANQTFGYNYYEETETYDQAETTTTSGASTVPVTFTYDAESAKYINTAYPVDHRFSSLGSSASSTFNPISDLSSTDADVTLIFVNKNAHYNQAVEDIWFNATEVAKDTSGFGTLEYTSLDPIAVMACTEQHQICDPTLPESTGCSALTGWEALQASQKYSGARLSVADDLAHAVSNSLLSNMVSHLGSSALLASLSVAGSDTLHSAALPVNQWQLEVESWTSYNLAHLQRLIASVATGPVLSSSAAYITPPTNPATTTHAPSTLTNLNTTILKKPTVASTFSPCHAQKILSQHHYSFPIFPLSLTLAIGCTVILLNLLLAPFLGLLSSLTGLFLSRKEAWEGDHALQLQRAAYEGANLGTWTGSAKGAHVPTTVYSALPERFGRPNSGAKGVYEQVEDADADASGVYDENNMSDEDVDVEKAAYGDGGKGFREMAHGGGGGGGRRSGESDRTSLADEDVRSSGRGLGLSGSGSGMVNGASVVYRDAESADPYARGADIGVKLEEEEEDGDDGEEADEGRDEEERERLARKRW